MIFRSLKLKKRTGQGLVLLMASLFCGALFCLTLVPVQAEELTAREIMEKVDAVEDGDHKISDMKMILIDKNEQTRERSMRSFTRDNGEDTWQLIFFTAPASVKDTGFLTYDYDDPDKDDDQWLYLPALKKTKRIAAGDKTDSFMGSDFSYADMTQRDIDNYDYKLLKEASVDGKKVWLIQAIPRNQHVIDTYGYSKSVVFVRQDNYCVVQAVNWVAGSDKLKYLKVKGLEKIDGIWVEQETHMTTRLGSQVEHKTILVRGNVKFNQDLDKAMFTVRRLEKGL